jgi:heavy metal sensor kinase
VIFRSIGSRLTLWYTIAFALGFGLLAGAMWLGVQRSLYHAIDDTLLERAAGIERFIEDHKTRLDVDEVKDEFRAHGELFQVFDADGTLVHRGAGLARLADAAAPPADAGADRFENVLASGEPLRFASHAIDVDGRVLTIQVAAPLHDLQEGLREASWVLLPMFPLMLLLAALGGYWLAKRALAPVDEITRTARSLSADNLSARLAVPRTNDELERLSTTLNEMLERLDAAFRRISRFTADASHELRTPLAVMRTTAEVALRAPARDAGEARAALEQIVAEVERTTHLTENLLLLAKADSGAAGLQRHDVDLAATVGEACAQAEVLARVKGLELAAELPERDRLYVAGDAQALRRLFLILLDNAVKYTPAGGRVEVALREHGDDIVGEVRDTGIGISPHDLPHVFDRFYRADRARSRELGGAGLGLSIARWIVESHGGAIIAVSELERGSRFEVRLPLR